MADNNNVTANATNVEDSTSEGEGGGGGNVVTWSAIWVTAVVATLQSIVFYAFFQYQRHKEKQSKKYGLYETRQFQLAHRSPEPFAESWWKEAWNVPQDELLRCVGLDSYMYLRFLRLGARIAAMGTVCSLVLIPVYATGNNTGPPTLEFNSLTLAKVEQGSDRMWATVLMWSFFVGFVLYEFWGEWKLFSKNRYDFLSKGDPDTPQDFRYAIRVEQLPSHLQTGEALAEYFERIFPNKVRQATVYLEISELQKLVDERQMNIETVEKAVAFTKAKPEKPPPQTKVGGMCGGAKVDAVEHCTEEIRRLNVAIDTKRHEILSAKGDKRLVSTTGVVTFTSLRAKQAAVQCELSGKKDVVTAFPAAEPKGILWKNVTVPLGRQHVFQLQMACFWIVGILFWAVPVAFVTSIANLNGILESLGLEKADASKAWYGLVAGLLPVVALAILMAVLYMAIVAAGTHWIRFKSAPEVDAYTLLWHQLFQFANLWLILIGGSLFNQLDSILDEPSSIVETVANALPAASIFFVNMISVSGLGNFGMELSCLPTYGVTLIMNIIQPEAMKTQRMLDASKKPPSIAWGQQIPPLVFIFMVTMLYMPIVPIVEAFAFVFFGGTYLVWKHQCLHVYAQEYEGGGLTTWDTLFGFLMSSLYIAEVVFIAYMGIKEAPGPAGCGFIPLIITILAHMIINRNIRAPLQNLSLEVAADMDNSEGELERDLTARTSLEEQLYAQPSLKMRDEERGPMPYRRLEEKDLESGTKRTKSIDKEVEISEDEEVEMKESRGLEVPSKSSKRRSSSMPKSKKTSSIDDEAAKSKKTSTSDDEAAKPSRSRSDSSKEPKSPKRTSPKTSESSKSPKRKSSHKQKFEI